MLVIHFNLKRHGARWPNPSCLWLWCLVRITAETPVIPTEISISFLSLSRLWYSNCVAWNLGAPRRPIIVRSVYQTLSIYYSIVLFLFLPLRAIGVNVLFLKKCFLRFCFILTPKKYPFDLQDCMKIHKFHHPIQTIVTWLICIGASPGTIDLS
jgi:hypothetical protein